MRQGRLTIMREVPIMDLLQRTGAFARRMVSAAGGVPAARRALRTSMLMVVLALPLATAGTAKAQEDSTAITTLYTSLLNGVGKGTGVATVGWAMSAIGLSGGDSNELNTISDELQDIDLELEDINATLTAISNEILGQTCVEAQISPSLQDAVNDITTRYGDYQTFIDNASMSPPTLPLQTDVDNWKKGVLDNDQVRTDMDDINNGVYATVNANVIDLCAASTAADYLGVAKTNTTFFDDRPSYSQLVDIVNYYYGVMVQGATILAEAYHLQACEDAANNDDADLKCNFATPSTSTSPSNASEICNDYPNDIDVQNDCLFAQEAVTEPGTGGGMYERVETWLTKAGAPYATDKIGMISSIESNPTDWDGSYAYLLPRDLLDFTNHAVINGQTQSTCASPLTSTDPCGFTVGAYDMQLPANLGYGGFGSDWKSATAGVLLHLFEPYNDKTDNSDFDFSNLVSDYLYSIGFSEATKNSALIVTTGNTGKNGTSGDEAICFMDTSSPRNQAKQPWCDGIQGQVQGTDNLLDNENVDECGPVVEKNWTQDLASQPDFYVANYCQGGGDKGWLTKPGWLESAQSNPGSKQSIFWQYHWPMIDEGDGGCQHDNGKPYLNPGGLLSRCGDVLTEYVNALLPPPESNTTALTASADTTLLRDQPNRNDGHGPLLRLAGRAAEQQIVIRFDEDRLQQFLAGHLLTSARLRLSSVGRRDNRRLEVRPLTDNFVEGNGNLDDQNFGRGTGATWNCAEDADVSDDVKDCLQDWSHSTFDRTPAPGRSHHWGGKRFGKGPERKIDRDRRHLQVSWDVTEDVQSGVHAWLIRVQRGAGRGPAYLSREGADLLRDPVRAPTLLLEGEPLEAHSITGVDQR